MFPLSSSSSPFVRIDDSLWERERICGQSDCYRDSPAGNSQTATPVNYVASAISPDLPAGRVCDAYLLRSPCQRVYGQRRHNEHLHQPSTGGTYDTVVQAWANCGNVGKAFVTITAGGETRQISLRAEHVGKNIAIYSIQSNGQLRFLKFAAENEACYGAVRTDPGTYLYAGACGLGTIPHGYGGLIGFAIDYRTGDLAPLPTSRYTYPQTGRTFVHDTAVTP